MTVFVIKMLVADIANVIPVFATLGWCVAVMGSFDYDDYDD